MRVSSYEGQEPVQVVYRWDVLWTNGVVTICGLVIPLCMCCRVARKLVCNAIEPTQGVPSSTQASLFWSASLIVGSSQHIKCLLACLRPP